MTYKPETFWESAHTEVPENEAGSGEGIRSVGGGSNAREAKYLYALRELALQRVFKQLTPQLPASKPSCLKLFEFGCGSGYWIPRLSNFLTAFQLEYSGVDISQTAVSRLKRRHRKHFFACMDNPEAAWSQFSQQEPFDISLAIDVLYHITEDEIWRKTLQCIADLTKTGGFFIFNDFGYCQSSPSPAKSHVKHRALQTYLDALEAGGFRVIHIEPVFFFFNRIKYGPFRDHSRPVAALWKMADHFSIFMHMLFWVDRIVPTFLRPLDIRCKNRFFLCRKESVN
jgi:SAM-dependent methyltransferase